MTDFGNESAVASALLTLTERESLAWEEFRPEEEELPQSPDVPEETSLFVTFHRGMDLYLWKSDDESDREDSSEVSTRLKIVDPEANAGWTLPTTGEVDDLYDVVQFRHASLKKWMQELVADAAEEDQNRKSRPSDESDNHTYEADAPETGAAEADAESDGLNDRQSSVAPSWSEESSDRVTSSSESETVESEAAEEGSESLSSTGSDEQDENSSFEGSENGAQEEGHVL